MAISLSIPPIALQGASRVTTPGAGRAALPGLLLDHPVLAAAQRLGAARGLSYAGDVSPPDAYELLQSGVARLVDVRTAEERKFVGYVPDSVHVPWMTGTSMQRNPRFSRELEAKVRKDEILMFLCRCGPRSVAAATASTQSKFAFSFNVTEGFEGDLDKEKHRGTTGGWCFHGLPWVQD